MFSDRFRTKKEADDHERRIKGLRETARVLDRSYDVSDRLVAAALLIVIEALEAHPCAKC